MKWTSNARMNQDAKEGTIFTFQNDGAPVQIHKYHGLGDSLYLTCHVLGLSGVALKTEDFDAAVEVAKKLIRSRIEVLTESFTGFMSDTSENTVSRY